MNVSQVSKMFSNGCQGNFEGTAATDAACISISFVFSVLITANGREMPLYSLSLSRSHSGTQTHEPENRTSVHAALGPPTPHNASSRPCGAPTCPETYI